MSRIPMPSGLADSVGRQPAEVAEPRDAATIVVLRDAADGTEAFLMRRQASMKFAAGFYVFPGGGLHASDWPQRSQVPWLGPDAQVWATRWRTNPDLAHALVVCAVRETFEETGILLAGPDQTSVVSDTSDLESARQAIEAHELAFDEFLREHRWSLRADLLGAWAHWITPAFEPRRYDTRFFVAALPDGQTVGALSREADEASWRPLAQVLADVDSGQAAMMPPTITTCQTVAEHAARDIVAVAGSRTFPVIEPTAVEVDGQWFLETGTDESESS